jgi:serpin B
MEPPMTKLGTCLAALACLSLACASRPATCSAPGADAGAVTALEAGNAELASDLLAQFGTLADGGNFAYSPFSISAALAMTYAGANTTTATQMAQTLHFTPAQADVPAAFAQIDCQIETDGQADNNQMNIANGLFGQAGAVFEKPFLTSLDQDYGAPLQQVDFANDVSAATNTIDAWVSTQTEGKIPQLFQPGDLTDQTVLVLADAIYFKGAWATQFKTSATQTGTFTRSDSSTVQVPLMNQTASFGYSQGSSFAVLEMPYAGNKLALDIVLPNAVDGLPALAQTFTASAFAGWVSQLGSPQVAVTLPKFSVDSRFNLTQTLSGMGMPAAFDIGPTPADFSGMDGKNDLFIGIVVHEATVEVDETGTVAAAATGVGMSGAEAVEEPLTFDANHPFLFVLRDLSTGTLLFVGQVTDPSAS